jgi:hypothetical protein
MKTNVVMLRKMGQFEVQQRTKDGYFNATDLLGQWNEFSGMQKQMVHFTENQTTKVFISEIMKQETKERDSVLLTVRGKSGGTWMHPLLFVDFAMWLNPTFKYHVLKFVADNLIQFRKDSGDSYRALCDALYPLIPKERFTDFIQKEAGKIKKACGVTDWQTATTEQLALRQKIEETAITIADLLPPAKVVEVAIKKVKI